MTSRPDLEKVRRFADGVHRQFLDKPLAYNRSPSFNWKTNLSPEQITIFQRELGAMGYKFQFVTLAGFHAVNTSMFELAHACRDEGMLAYSRLQQKTPDFREAEVHHVGGGELKKVQPAPALVPKPV